MKYSMYNVVWYDGVYSYVSKFILPENEKKAKNDLLDWWDCDGEILKLDRLYGVSFENVIALRNGNKKTMREFKASTERGQKIIAMRSRCCWQSLRNLYKTWSVAKQSAYDWCRSQYEADENASGFGIGNANTYGFTASWLTVIGGEKALRVETKDNSYLVWLDR